MPDVSDVTVVLSGPLAQRGPVLASLDRAGMRIEDSRSSHGLPNDPTVGWVTVRHADVDAVTKAAPGYSLRLHWNTPDCPACAGRGFANAADIGAGTCLHCEGSGRSNKPAKSVEQQMFDQIAELRAELASLKAGH